MSSSPNQKISSEDILANSAKNLIAYGLTQYDDVNRQDTLTHIKKNRSKLKRVEYLQFSNNGTRLKTYSLFYETPENLDIIDSTTPPTIDDSTIFEVHPSPLLNLLKDLKPTVIWSKDQNDEKVLDYVSRTVENHKGFLRSKIVPLQPIRGLALTMLTIYFKILPEPAPTPTKCGATTTRDYFKTILSDDPNKLPSCGDWTLQKTVGTGDGKALLTLWVPSDWEKSEILLVDAKDPKKVDQKLLVSAIREVHTHFLEGLNLVTIISPKSLNKIYNFSFDKREDACQFAGLVTTVIGFTSS